MNQRKQLPVCALMVALLGVAGYAYYGAQVRQLATLARITALETRLAASNQQRARAAQTTVLSISEVVRKNHNQAHDMSVLQQAQQIRDSTQLLLARLHQLRQAWQNTASKPDMGALPAQADRYVRFVRQFAPKMLPLPKPAAQTAAVGWLGEFDMATDSQPARLAQLTKLETQVRQEAAAALEAQARKVGSEVVFDKIGAFVAPASTTVAPGAIYEAKLALIQVATSGRTRFDADGHAVPIAPATGQALVRFRVPAACPGQPDTVRAQWRGRVQAHWSTTDTVLETTVPYFIVKPRSH